MAASIAAAAALFPAGAGSSSGVSGKSSNRSFGECPESLDVRGSAPRPGTSSTTAKKAGIRAQALPKVNGHKVKGDTEEETVSISTASKTFYNQLPDLSMLLAAITTIFLAAERQFTLLDWKPKRPDMLSDTFGLGRIMPDGLVFRQNFSIRSYEIGADRTASIETMMNHLQETALNHVKSAGLLGDGFGSTPEMMKRNLIWVVNRMEVMVDHYPSWGDVVEVDTWVGASGKNGMRRDWHIRDYNTGQTILQATSKWVMMDKLTRKLARVPDEVRTEIEPYFIELKAIDDEDKRKLPKLQDKERAVEYVRKGLKPRWGDLDVNQHVNNVKYIGWILESAPISIFEKHELVGMMIDYRKECGRDSVLQSHTTVHGCGDDPGDPGVCCDHQLSLESGPAVLKARTIWRPKAQHKDILPTTTTAAAADL